MKVHRATLLLIKQLSLFQSQGMNIDPGLVMQKYSHHERQQMMKNNIFRRVRVEQ